MKMMYGKFQNYLKMIKKKYMVFIIMIVNKGAVKKLINSFHDSPFIV